MNGLQDSCGQTEETKRSKLDEDKHVLFTLGLGMVGRLLLRIEKELKRRQPHQTLRGRNSPYGRRRKLIAAMVQRQPTVRWSLFKWISKSVPFTSGMVTSLSLKININLKDI